MSDDRLARLRFFANRVNPDGDWGEHSFDARCPWCRPDSPDQRYHDGGGHETALFLLDEIDRLRGICEQHGIDPEGCTECFCETTGAGPGHELVEKGLVERLRDVAQALEEELAQVNAEAELWAKR